jgi:two-component system cell cycle sensor histidine kinase/response regulator CckA
MNAVPKPLRGNDEDGQENRLAQRAQAEDRPQSDLRFLFENAPIGVAQCTSQGTVMAMNPALEQMIAGRLPSTARPLCFGDLIHQDDRGESERLLHQMFSGARPSFRVENRIFGADDDMAPWVRWTSWRVHGDGRNPGYGLVIAEDVTETRQSQLRLRQAEKLEAVGRLASGVAHDFNNLLTGVMLYCDLILAGLESTNRLSRYVEEIRAAGMQAAGLVRQLLAVARPQNLEPRLLSLNDVAEGMRNLLVRLIGENIQLHFRFDPDLALVTMDAAQVQQILLNLVLNARDALPDGGQIMIETSNCKMQILAPSLSGKSKTTLPCVLFVVSDNGKGMNAQVRKHLFDAFFTTKEVGKGTGLGLTTVHSIVTASGGLIQVDSEPNSGTRVNVLLPVVPEAVSRSPDVNDMTKKEKVPPQHQEELL